MCLTYSDRYVVAVSLGSLLFGYAISSLNTVIKHLTLLYQWCGDSTTLLCPKEMQANTVVFVGAALGAFMGGVVARRGRRKAFMLTQLLFMIGGVVCAAVTKFWAFILGRTVVGLAVGFASVSVPLFISEMTPTNIRGSRGVMHQFMITVGIFMGIAMGLTLSPLDSSNPQPLTLGSRRYLRFLLAFPSLISTMTFSVFVCLFRDDTPAYYVGAEETSKAARVLQRIYSKDDVERELRDLVLANEENLRRQREDKSLGLFEAFGYPAYRWVIIVGAVLSIGQQLSGINVFVSMSTSLFEGAGLKPSHSSLASTFMALVNTIVTIPASLIVERLGRRTLLIAGTLGQVASLSIVPITFLIPGSEPIRAYVAVASVIGFIVFFAVAYGPVLWLYLPEMFPPEIRSSATGLASGLNWVATICIVAFSNQVGVSHILLNFSMFCGLSFLSFLWVVLFMKETRGLSYSPYFPTASKDDMMTSLVGDEESFLLSKD